jgi:uridine kinase
LAAQSSEVHPNCPHMASARVEGRRLLAFLDWFLPYSSDIVPSNSILREFIGGSILEEFRPWRVMNGQ